MTIELLAALPVLLVAIIAATQFGYYFQRVEQLELSSRVGAIAAARTAGLGTGSVPADIALVINQQLASNNITTTAIILEHNVNGSEQVMRTDYVANSLPEPTVALPTRSVRVTVYVPLSDLMPNTLAFFGFNIATRHAVSTTTFGYDL